MSGKIKVSKRASTEDGMPACKRSDPVQENIQDFIRRLQHIAGDTRQSICAHMNMTDEVKEARGTFSTRHTARFMWQEAVKAFTFKGAVNMFIEKISFILSDKAPLLVPLRKLQASVD